MFPAMLLGPSIAGVASTTVMQGRAGLRELFQRMRRIGRRRWVGTLAIPPLLVLVVLYGLSTFLSPVFAPNRFWIGLSFGCAAGFFEEIGWTGFAFRTMNSKQSALGAATLLGVLWAAWHIPVVDFLGSATPHGNYWLCFLLAFAAAMTAIRVLICWIYCNTNSVLLAQMFHASSTGALATFGPAGVTAGDEALWYAVYALVLWTIVACVTARFGTTLTNGPQLSGS
jgi:membrane protease YdiL (CAAX protease family)